MKINVLMVIGCLAAASLPAQEYRGAISGTVTDQQGAAEPRAKIIATETRTGAKSTAISEDSGAYTIPFLTPGEYTISAEAPGFKKYARKGLTLSMGTQPVIDIRLEVGTLSESVTVTADAPLIESANGSLGQVITTQEVEDFPLNGRMPLMLANLALGAIATIEPGPVRPFDNGTPGGGVMLGGAPAGNNEILLNGAPNAAFTRQLAYSPPQDAVEEVRVTSFASDAAFGHTSGGTVNQVTKGGTNSFRGAAYDFVQVSKLDANSFFTNRAGTPNPAYHYNQYGLAVGGPVIIPKVFNGKNRLFWFFAWEGLKDSDPATSPIETGNPVNFATVPTAAERKGDFSALLNVNNSYTIYDPATGVASGTHTSRMPFPNNIIPTSRLNPIALNYLQFYPLPNAPGRADGLQNYVVNAVDSDKYDNELGRLDFNLSDKNKLSYDFRHSNRNQNKNPYFPNIATGTFLYRTNQGSSLDDVITISPTVVVDIRANWTRYIETHASPSDGFDPATLGFPSYIGGNSQSPVIPFLTFNSCSVSAGSASNFQCLGSSGNGVTTFDTYQLFATVVKLRRNHSFKVGADIRDSIESAFTPGNSAGTYTFKSKWTSAMENSTAAPLGQEFASFLLGLPDSGSFDLNSHSTAGSKYYAFFVQDDWRIRSNLTINLGLRWEHETPTVERFNRATNGFDPTAVNPISAAAAAAYAKNPVPQIPVDQFPALGGLTFASPSHRNVYNSKSSIFSPRFGFAWVPRALGSKTVIRGGFGVFVNPNGINGTLALNQQGFSQTTQFVATNDTYRTPAGSLSNPFPNGFVQPAGSSKGAGTFLGQQIAFFNPQALDSYSLRYDFSIQHQLPGQMVLEVAYIGNHSVHQPITNTQLDSIPRRYLSTSPTRDDATINLLTGTVQNPFQGLLPNSAALNGAMVPLGQLLAPFPQYPLGSGTTNGILLQDNFGGSSYYHSLNVRLQKRFTHGLTLINNFIWNKAIDKTTYLNDTDPAPEKRISGYPLREVLAATYQLPIGRGKLIDFGTRLGNSLLGGWSVNGILTLQSGPVLGWGNLIYYGGPLNFSPHNPNGPTFDIAQFNTVTMQQLANNIRTFDTQFNNLRRDSSKNLDVSMLKSFPLGERRYLQVRFESFNTTNRVTFGSPNLTATTTAFGTVGSQANTPRRIQMGARLVW